MEKTSGILDIGTRLEGANVVIEVSDNGPGIPEANLERIFDPFFTTKPVGKGTGLGLSICYGIIKRMGGTIKVRSTVGKGTTFIITLPASRGVAGESPSRPGETTERQSVEDPHAFDIDPSSGAGK
jgi:two-component system, NtrC family, sensor kinase